MTCTRVHAALVVVAVGCGGAAELEGPGEAPTPISTEAPASSGGEGWVEQRDARDGTTETVAVASAAAERFGIMAQTETGLAGRMILNGTVIADFEAAGHRVAGNLAQCALRPGANSLGIEVTRRAASAAARPGGALVQISLHALADGGGFPGADNRLFEIRWDPSGPGRRVYEFELRPDQIPAASSACGDADPEIGGDPGGA